MTQLVENVPESIRPIKGALQPKRLFYENLTTPQLVAEITELLAELRKFLPRALEKQDRQFPSPTTLKFKDRELKYFSEVHEACEVALIIADHNDAIPPPRCEDFRFSVAELARRYDSLAANETGASSELDVKMAKRVCLAMFQSISPPRNGVKSKSRLCDEKRALDALDDPKTASSFLYKIGVDAQESSGSRTDKLQTYVTVLKPAYMLLTNGWSGAASKVLRPTGSKTLE